MTVLRVIFCFNKKRQTP